MGRSALRLAFAALLSLLLSSTASAQQSRHYNNWIFGNSCRVTWDANDNITVSSTLEGGGSIGFTTQEGSATWSDPATGALILYTDGIRVWNNLGEVVTDTNLKGNPSSLNSGIILPVPETPNQYFVIANPASSGAVMTITRFDFSQTKAGNTGPGKVLVAEKNITGTESTSEAAQVALHSNKKDFWLISKDNTGIIVVPITKDGAGAVQRYEQGTNIKGNQYNGMRVNNSSTKIANLYINNVEIYDFDASTGVVSNRQSVGTHDTSDSYGAEFSPDDTKLYTSSSSSIYQFDLANSNARVNMFSGVTYPYIALGRDGKIYIPHYQQAFLHTITNPNAPAGGGATFNPDGLPLAQGCITTLGLPLALATNIAPPGVNPVTVNPLATTDTTPAITGTVNLNQGANETFTVRVTGNGYDKTFTFGTDNELQVNGSDWTLTIGGGTQSQNDVLADGTYEIAAKVKNNDTSQEQNDTTNNELVVDTTAPAGPVTVVSLTTNNQTPTVTGTATIAQGETLTVTINGVTYSEANNNLVINGTDWMLDAQSLNPGTYPVTATITDAVGNATSDSTTNELVIDTTAPGNATLDQPLYYVKAGQNDAQVSGTWDASAGNTLNVTIGGLPTNRGLNGSSFSASTFSFLGDGTYDVVVTTTDEAGNQNVQTFTGAVVIDRTVPNPPTVNAVGVTQNKQPALSGTAEPNSTVDVTLDGTTYSGLPVDGNGNWGVPQWPVQVSDGTHNIVVTATDAAGNTSQPDSTTNEITVDTTAPNPPTVNFIGVTNNPKPNIGGTAEPNTVISITLNGHTHMTASDAGGFWSYPWPDVVQDGTHDIVVTSKDAAGNTSQPDSTTNEITVDTTPPGPATLAPPTYITNAANPQISGTWDNGAGHTLNVTIGGFPTNRGLTGGNFTASTFNNPPEGTYDVVVTTTDAAGNVTTQTFVGAVTIDRTAPQAPTVENQWTNQTTGINIVGTPNPQGLPQGETLTVTVDGQTYQLGGFAGQWVLGIPSLAEGSYPIVATITDLAGNQSQATATLVVDTTNPEIPTVESQLTNSATPTVTGSVVLAEGESFTVKINGVEYTVGGGHLTYDSQNDTWSLVIPQNDALQDGTYSVDVTVTDQAGNSSKETTDNELVVDTTAPTAPTVNTLLSNSATPTISGSFPASDTEVITVEVNGKVYKDTEIQINGDSWSVTTETLTDGSYDVKVTIKDKAGNTVGDQSANELTVDLTPPAAATVNGLATNNNTPTLGGDVLVEENGRLEVTVNGKTYTENDGLFWGKGEWSLTIPQNDALADGTYEVLARTFDEAGNSTDDATSNELLIDTQPPTAPSVDSVILSDSTPTITGTATLVGDDSLTVTVNGKTYTVGDGNLSWDQNTGKWTLVVPDSDTLADGKYNVSATITDGANNTASDDSNDELTVDTTPPSKPYANNVVTNDTTPSLTGSATLLEGEVLTVTVNGKTYTAGDGNLSTSTNGDGWTLQIPDGEPLPEGIYDVKVTVTDLAGNSTSDETTDELTIDLTAPNTPTFTATATKDTTPTISGTATVGDSDTLTVTVNGKTYTVGDGNLTLNGTTWSLTIPGGSELPEGVYDVTVTVTDKAGNSSSDSTSNELTIDTTPPAAPTVTPLVSNSYTPTLSGTATMEDGGTLTVEVNGVIYSVGDGYLSVSNGSWSLTIPEADALDNGTYEVKVVSGDAVGNTSTDSTSDELVVDDDTDNDGIKDSDEIEGKDSDGDGIPDSKDEDSDNDGIPDKEECKNKVNGKCPDTDGDGKPDQIDEDSDNDGISDKEENGKDENNNGIPDGLEPFKVNGPTPGSVSGTLTTNLNGKGEPGEVVTVTVDGQSQTVTVDADGNWSLDWTFPSSGPRTATVQHNGFTENVDFQVGPADYNLRGGTFGLCSSSPTQPAPHSGALALLLLACFGLLRRWRHARS